jgi:hypothetical protein
MKVIRIMLVAALLSFFAACGGKGGGDVSPEMKNFMGGFGSASKVGDQLKKFGKGGLDTKDMEMYDLKDPAVVKTKKNGAVVCYDISTKAGITTRYFTVCWEGGKISSVTDHMFNKPE